MDDKVMKILALQEQGMSRKEIYQIMEYKEINSLNRFMKRKGYILDGGKYKRAEAPNNMIDAMPEDFKENMINLVNQYDKLQEMINWFNTKDAIDNTNVIEVNTGIKIDLPEAPIKRTTIRVNESVWNDFLDLADANNEFDKHNLLSMALKEYVEKYKK